MSGELSPEKLGRDATRVACAPRRAHSGLCVVIERFKEARPTQSWTKVGKREEGGEEREESKKRARWKT